MSKLLSNLLADERRQLYSGGVNTSNHVIPRPNNEKYMEHLSRTQTIRENIGLVYNDDSIGQLNNGAIPKPIPVVPDREPRYLVINSADRDWINRTDESPYHYNVSIGGSSIANGRNINITINNVLENVTSLKCEGLILTNRAHLNGFKPSNQPFIMINLDTVNDVVYGSNKYLDDSLAQMVTKIPFPVSLDDIRYLQLVNQGQTKKIFQTPEARVGRLTIQITRADGTSVDGLAGSQRDTANILRMVYVGSYLISIYTTEYFSGLDWQAGDIIQIRNYTMRGTAPANMGYYERVKFNNWINSESGHIIHSIDKAPIGTEMYNIINIKSPGDWSTASGDYENYTWFTDLVTKTEIDVNSGTDTGKMLNENLQTTLFITAEVLTKNAYALLK